MHRVALALALAFTAAAIAQHPTAGMARASLSQGTEDPPTVTVTPTIEAATGAATAAETSTPTITAVPTATPTATFKPWITPTLTASKRCKLEYNHLILKAEACLFLPRALKVHPTPTITPTPLPTSTPIPAATCRQVVQNPSFEDTPSLWSNEFPDDFGLQDVTISRETINAAPLDGKLMLQMWADNDNEVAASSSRSAPVPQTLTSATIRYSWFGHSLERLPNKDTLLAVIRDPSATFDLKLVKGYVNQDTVNHWTSEEISVAPIIRDNTFRQVAVLFGAQNDITDSTWWHIDLVTLTICGTGWPAADVTTSPQPERAQDVATQLDRLARDVRLNGK